MALRINVFQKHISKEAYKYMNLRVTSFVDEIRESSWALPVVMKYMHS